MLIEAFLLPSATEFGFYFARRRVNEIPLNLKGFGLLLCAQNAWSQLE